MFKKIIGLILAAAFFGGALAGCNTVEGFGKDVQRGGTAIKNEANEHRR